uniref:Uncharacterized protein TCIL3000_10_850 n=1 Tax=Trypanosoma congolense (strain IL3000) TaxID=1068625 RepID=G0UVB1_TRYCI|nr:unnamed protein product [Trypanosoma congolense IL3000]
MQLVVLCLVSVIVAAVCDDPWRSSGAGSPDTARPDAVLELCRAKLSLKALRVKADVVIQKVEISVSEAKKILEAVTNESKNAFDSRRKALRAVMDSGAASGTMARIDETVNRCEEALADAGKFYDRVIRASGCARDSKAGVQSSSAETERLIQVTYPQACMNTEKHDSDCCSGHTSEHSVDLLNVRRPHCALPSMRVPRKGSESSRRYEQLDLAIRYQETCFHLDAMEMCMESARDAVDEIGKIQVRVEYEAASTLRDVNIVLEEVSADRDKNTLAKLREDAHQEAKARERARAEAAATAREKSREINGKIVADEVVRAEVRAKMADNTGRGQYVRIMGSWVVTHMLLLSC